MQKSYNESLDAFLHTNFLCVQDVLNERMPAKFASLHDPSFPRRSYQERDACRKELDELKTDKVPRLSSSEQRKAAWAFVRGRHGGRRGRS